MVAAAAAAAGAAVGLAGTAGAFFFGQTEEHSAAGNATLVAGRFNGTELELSVTTPPFAFCLGFPLPSWAKNTAFGM